MPTFDQVSTEYTDSLFMGVQYGSKVRILMRSPSHFIFVVNGVHLMSRKSSHSFTDRVTLTQKATRTFMSDATVIARIDEVFGEGAGNAALIAATTRGKGTILVDGGGEKFRLPGIEQRAMTQAAFDAVTPTKSNLLPVEKKCIQCGCDLKPYTDVHHLDPLPKSDQHPKTIEDCQRLTNYPVFAVHGFDTRYPKYWQYIEWFETWDGVSYLNEPFCGNNCAAIYGRRAADELPLLPVGGAAPKPSRKQQSSVKHYEQEIKFINGFRV